MSTPRTILICDSYEHAEAVDKLVLHGLDVDHGIKGNAWSEVYSDGERYGILWGGPVAEMFGEPRSTDCPDGDPALVLVTDTDGAWRVVQPVPEPTEDI